ncbi:MAG: BAX inhibitor (BI)-1/YccA family protein [Chloroflexi bacterium]|jgi:FtsH-binding integral membrane protein|nr:BAX inhibitor (BI)-1/YccA family protein [Chloroflexota bacterium]
MSIESQYEQNVPLPVSEERLSTTFVAVMTRVYLWMTLGLGLTTVVSIWVLNNPALLNFFFERPLALLGLFVVQIALVIALVAAIQKLSTGAALALFFVYAALMGFTLSSIFMVYDIGTITMAFGVTAVVFVLLSIVGMTTKQDLTRWGPILLFALIGLIIGTVVNMFLRSSMLDLIITYAGILIFMGLIVFDTKYIKQMTYSAATQENTDAIVGRLSIIGALKLYLDFINLFLFLLRLLGRR